MGFHEVGNHLLFDNCLPVLFRTRAEARAYINEKYGYIRDREDLRRPPHSWRVPVAVRVRVSLLMMDPLEVPRARKKESPK